MKLPEFRFPATIFSADRAERFTLSREWLSLPVVANPARSERFVQFVGLNPSKADEVINDNTVTKCMHFARAWGFGGMVMTNIHGLRSTDPTALYGHGKDDDKPDDNLPWVLAVAEKAALIVCCWGNHGVYLGRGKHVAETLAGKHPEKLAVLARKIDTIQGGANRPGFVMACEPLINSTGHPKHPCRESNSLVWATWDGKGCRQ